MIDMWTFLKTKIKKNIYINITFTKIGIKNKKKTILNQI